MQGPKIHEWLDLYGLKTRLAFGPELNKEEMLSNDHVCTQVNHYSDGPIDAD